ncbi:hypothetical protein BESB_025270 [Besnoitia besnoiti]|uniref:DOT1 domain-containing protein n=1 Tax=Besnoitia besnoiti TaxID=94643 RepID=A0A2A9M5I5_BESBE|nr:uncharacterized protein BESB_025270 [Besnoitia besnoiti]PFH31561.1 hypothetical protein BESB_025270 [Besnoitia besnoiti]
MEMMKEGGASGLGGPDSATTPVANMDLSAAGISPLSAEVLTRLVNATALLTGDEQLQRGVNSACGTAEKDALDLACLLLLGGRGCAADSPVSLAEDLGQGEGADASPSAAVVRLSASAAPQPPLPPPGALSASTEELRLSSHASERPDAGRQPALGTHAPDSAESLFLSECGAQVSAKPALFPDSVLRSLVSCAGAGSSALEAESGAALEKEVKSKRRCSEEESGAARSRKLCKGVFAGADRQTGKDAYEASPAPGRHGAPAAASLQCCDEQALASPPAADMRGRSCGLEARCAEARKAGKASKPTGMPAARQGLPLERLPRSVNAAATHGAAREEMTERCSAFDSSSGTPRASARDWQLKVTGADAPASPSTVASRGSVSFGTATSPSVKQGSGLLAPEAAPEEDFSPPSSRGSLPASAAIRAAAEDGASPSPPPSRDSGASEFCPVRVVPQAVANPALFSSVRRLQRRSLMKLTGSDEGAYGENCCASLLTLFRLLQERYGLSPASVFLDIGSGSGVPSFLAASAVGCVASLGVEVDSNVYAIACNNHLKLLDERLLASLGMHDLLGRLKVRALRLAAASRERSSGSSLNALRERQREQEGEEGAGGHEDFLAPLEPLASQALRETLRARVGVTEEDLLFSVANVNSPPAALDDDGEGGGRAGSTPGARKPEAAKERNTREKRAREEGEERNAAKQEAARASLSSSVARFTSADSGREAERTCAPSLPFSLTPAGLAYPCNVGFKCADASLFATFDGVSHIFSFDLAMPPRVLFRLCSVFNRSKSPVVYVSFHSSLVSTYGLKARLVQRLCMRMAGSAESHVAFIYVRENCLAFVSPPPHLLGDAAGRPSWGPGAVSEKPQAPFSAAASSSFGARGLCGRTKRDTPEAGEEVPADDANRCGLQGSRRGKGGSLPHAQAPGRVDAAEASRGRDDEDGGTGGALMAVGSRGNAETWMDMERAQVMRALFLRGMALSRTEKFFSRCVLAGVLPRVAFTLLHSVAHLCAEVSAGAPSEVGAEETCGQAGRGKTDNNAEGGEETRSPAPSESGSEERTAASMSSFSVVTPLACCRKCCADVFTQEAGSQRDVADRGCSRTSVENMPSIRGFPLPLSPLPQQQLLLLRRLFAAFGLDQLLEAGALSFEQLSDLLLLRPAAACACRLPPAVSSREQAPEERTGRAAGAARGAKKAHASLRSLESFVCSHGVERLARFLVNLLLRILLVRVEQQQPAETRAVAEEPLTSRRDALSLLQRTLLEVRVCRNWEKQRQRASAVSLDAWGTEASPLSRVSRRSARARRTLAGAAGAAARPAAERVNAVIKEISTLGRMEDLHSEPGARTPLNAPDDAAATRRLRNKERQSALYAERKTRLGGRASPLPHATPAEQKRGNGATRGVQQKGSLARGTKEANDTSVRTLERGDSREALAASLDEKWMRFHVRYGQPAFEGDDQDAGVEMQVTEAPLRQETGLGGVLELPCLSPLCYTCGDRSLLPQLLEANAPPAVQQLKIQSEILQLQTNPLIQLADKEGQEAWEAKLRGEAEAFLFDSDEDSADSDDEDAAASHQQLAGGAGTRREGSCALGTSERKTGVSAERRCDASRGPRGAEDEESMHTGASEPSRISEGFFGEGGCDSLKWEALEAPRPLRCRHAARAAIVQRLGAFLSLEGTCAVAKKGEEASLEERAFHDLLDARLQCRVKAKGESPVASVPSHLSESSSVCASSSAGGLLAVEEDVASGVSAERVGAQPRDAPAPLWVFSQSPSEPICFLASPEKKNPRVFEYGDTAPLVWPCVRAVTHAGGEAKKEVTSWNVQFLRVQQQGCVAPGVGDPRGAWLGARGSLVNRGWPCGLAGLAGGAGWHVPRAEAGAARQRHRGPAERVSAASLGAAAQRRGRGGWEWGRRAAEERRGGAQDGGDGAGGAFSASAIDKELDRDIAPGLDLFDCWWELHSFPVSAECDAGTRYREARAWLMAELEAQELRVIQLLSRLNAPLLRLSRQAALDCLHRDAETSPEEFAQMQRLYGGAAEHVARLWQHARFLEHALLQEFLLANDRGAERSRLAAGDRLVHVRYVCLLSTQLLRLQQLQKLRELGDPRTSPARANALIKQLHEETWPQVFVRLPADARDGSFPEQQGQAPPPPRLFRARAPEEAADLEGRAGDHDARAKNSGAGGAEGSEEAAGSGPHALWQAPAEAVTEVAISLVASLFRAERTTARVEDLVDGVLRLWEILCSRTHELPAEEMRRRGEAERASAVVDAYLCSFLPALPARKKTRGEHREQTEMKELRMLCSFLRRKLDEFRKKCLAAKEEEERALMLWLLERENSADEVLALEPGKRDFKTPFEATASSGLGGGAASGTRVWNAASGRAERGEVRSSTLRTLVETATTPCGGLTQDYSRAFSACPLKANQRGDRGTGLDTPPLLSRGGSPRRDHFAFAFFEAAGAHGMLEAFSCIPSLPACMEGILRNPVAGAPCPLWRSYFLRLGLVHAAKELLLKRSLLEAGALPVAPTRRRLSLTGEGSKASAERPAAQEERGGEFDLQREAHAEGVVAAGAKLERDEIPSKTSHATATVHALKPVAAQQAQRESGDDSILASPRAPKKRRSAECRAH